MADTLLQNQARSLAADTAEILPYIPYLVQDLQTLGSSPEDMYRLFATHIPLYPAPAVIDLCCGKGSVALHLSQELGLRAEGIDLMEAFIEEARQTAQKKSLSHLCTFRVGDLHQTLGAAKQYDCVVYGAVGDVLGDRAETLKRLSPIIKPNGYLLIDDGYTEPERQGRGNPASSPTLAEWEMLCRESGFRLVDFCTSSATKDDFEQELLHIVRRADELTASYPDKAGLFEAYVQNQREEYSELSTICKGAAFLLKKTAPPA